MKISHFLDDLYLNTNPLVRVCEILGKSGRNKISFWENDKCRSTLLARDSSIKIVLDPFKSKERQSTSPLFRIKLANIIQIQNFQLISRLEFRR